MEMIEAVGYNAADDDVRESRKRFEAEVTSLLTTSSTGALETEELEPA
jgi:hypothetical protein